MYVFLAALPAVREWHTARGIPDDVSWVTLADLGRHTAIYRRMNGRPGFDEQRWLSLHFRGAIYELGRLQFERRADHALDVHIPESGPLDPEACTASFAAARKFFAQHFPEEEYSHAVCTSWLLDPQLREYLPPSSNIVQFQERFELVDEGEDGDEDVVGFVFRRRWPVAIDELPRGTTLERAVGAHLAVGRHWRTPTGRLVL